MTMPQDAPANPVSITVTASTKNPNDTDRHHCFEQDEKWIITFKMVVTDRSVNSIYFVLWNLQDPVHPKFVEEHPDVSVDENGVATIDIGPDRPHLGPGPYCATLTASSPDTAPAASKGARKIVGNAVYYYDTWKGQPPYTWPV